MTFINDFHRETVEKCKKIIAASKSLKLDSQKEVMHMKEMHRQIALRYPHEK